MKKDNTNLEWVEPLSKQLKGKVSGNFIMMPEKISTGNRYFLDCDNGLSAMYIDIKYNADFKLIQENKNDDFVAFYYSLIDGHAHLTTKELSNTIGKWHYNLIVIDSSLKHEYVVKSGTKVFTVCLFVKKSTIQDFIKKSNKMHKDIPRLLDPKKNTFIEFSRMTNENLQHLLDLKNIEVGTQVFNLQLSATANLLFSDYMDKLATEKSFIQKVNDLDLSYILSAQKKLTQNLELNFPGLEAMAKEANMSESKFKTLFKKITRTSPNAFYLNNKLQRAKDLLEQREHTIAQVSDQLNFATNSYFISKFKGQFGMTPKTYTQQLT